MWVDMRQLWRTMGIDKQGRAADGPEYPVADVRQLLAEGKVIIQPNARRDAFRDFGWDTDDIVLALRSLKPQHFHKRDVSTGNRWHVWDFYKAWGLRGEDVYTHFYIDSSSGMLVINSFKRI